MWSKSAHISFARHLIWCLLLFTSVTCSTNDPVVSSDHLADANETIVFETDSTEWHVCVFTTGKLYEDAMQVPLPLPWQFPTREDAQILKTLTYPSDERFVTCDGYTFGMPSSSVTKAGMKTKYSVLGLYIRRTVIEVGF